MGKLEVLEKYRNFNFSIITVSKAYWYEDQELCKELEKQNEQLRKLLCPTELTMMKRFTI